MIGASNLGQQARFWRAVERADMIKTDNEAREQDRDREAAIIADIIKTKTADEWERYFQARHVPAAGRRRSASRSATWSVACLARSQCSLLCWSGPARRGLASGSTFLSLSRAFQGIGGQQTRGGTV